MRHGARSDGLSGGIRIRLRALRQVRTGCLPVSSSRAVLPVEPVSADAGLGGRQAKLTAPQALDARGAGIW